MSVAIHPTAIIEDGAIIGENVKIGAYSCIGPNVTIGDNCTLHSHVIIDGDTTFGADNELFPFAVIGKAPQHFQYQGEATTIVIGARNTFRENTSVHPGTAVDKMTTTIGDDNMFFIGTHVAHDCVIGNNNIMANDSMLGGHVVLEDYVYIGGNTAVRQWMRIGAHAMIGGMSAVLKDVTPYGYVLGIDSNLIGANLIGMKRRDIHKDDIAVLRQAYRLLFFNAEGTFGERLEKLEQNYGGYPIVDQVLDFIKHSGARSVCQPVQKG
jgi:UDP-N-acetylglucosamine acyltransferase